MTRNYRFLRSVSILALVGVVTFTSVQPTYAVTSKELQEEKNAAEKEKKESEKKLDSVQGNIDSISEEMEAAEEELAVLDEQLVDLLLSVELLQGDIEYKKKQIEQAQIDYDEAVKTEEAQKEAMRRRIKFMYEKGNETYLEIFVESKSMAEVVNKVEYSEKLYSYDRLLLEKYELAKQEVANTQAKLEDDLNELEEIEEDYEVQQEELNALIEEQRESVENFESQLSSAKAKAKEYQKQIKDQIDNLKRISDEQEAVAAEEARKKAEEEARQKALEAARKKAEEEAKAEAAKRSANSDSSDGTMVIVESADGTVVKRSSVKSTDLTDKDNVAQDAGTLDTTAGTTTDTSSSTADTSSTQQTTQNSGAAGVTATGSGKGTDIANYALQFVGNPYVSGGTSLTNGADCSGFTQTVYADNGIKIPRSSYSQSEGGTEVDYSNIQAGDIIYYGGHVAIYIGNDKIVHASTPSTGIKISSAFYRSIVTIRRYY